MFDPCVNIKHHKLETPDAETRENRSLPRQLPKRSGTCFPMVWIIEWRAIDSLHKTCGKDTSLPSKQKKISQRSNVQAKIRPSNMFDQSVIPKHHKHKTHDGETGENRSLPRQLLKGVELTLLWCKTSNAEQQTVHTRLAAMTKVFHSGRKNISQGSIGPYNTPKQL